MSPLHITQHMSVCLERTRRMPNVPLTFISVNERISIRLNTLMPYAVAGLHFYQRSSRFSYLIIIDMYVSALYCELITKLCNFLMHSSEKNQSPPLSVLSFVRVKRFIAYFCIYSVRSLADNHNFCQMDKIYHVLL